MKGDRVAQWVQHGTRHSMTQVQTPLGAQEKIKYFFQVKNVVLTHSQCAQPPCVYARIRMITDPVINVRVWWIMELNTQKTSTHFTEG